MIICRCINRRRCCQIHVFVGVFQGLLALHIGVRRCLRTWVVHVSKQLYVMNRVQLAVVGVLLLILTYQVWVSMYVFRAPEYAVKQRVAQILLVWLIPVIGAVLCHIFLSNSRQNEARTDFQFVQQSPNDAGPGD